MTPIWSELTVDIVLTIAFSIPEASSLFAFLEALRPYKMLGPLEHLYLLGLTHWLKTYLSPTTQISWNLQDMDTVLPIEDVDNWTDLRITRLAIDITAEEDAIWCLVALSKLPSLTSLDLAIWATDLADFFAYVAASQQITDLYLEFDQYQLTDFDLMHLTEWFRQQPVKRFECSGGDWIDADYNVKQAFYHAMFNCPTLEILEISTCDLDDIDWTQLDFSMKTLVLDQCGLSDDDVRIFASRLEGSSITTLVLTDYAFDDIYAMECLLQVQPSTRIKQLGLNGINMDGQTWSKKIWLRCLIGVP
ncbi:unnamed protein product [Aphanomyces euteiches]